MWIFLQPLYFVSHNLLSITNPPQNVNHQNIFLCHWHSRTGLLYVNQGHLRISVLNLIFIFWKFVDIGNSLTFKIIIIISLLLHYSGTKTDTTKAPFFHELYESITIYIGVDISENPVFMRVLKTFIKIYGYLKKTMI